jgi:hypothetical protein
MGTWGTGLYSDDLACDLRDEYRDLVAEGASADAVVDALLGEYADSSTDQDEAGVFWLTLADVSWRLGRLQPRVLERALVLIESGQDLDRWTGRDRSKREAVLRTLRAKLLSPQPAPRKLTVRPRHETDWRVGEVVGYRLLSGDWTLLRVTMHHEDRGGRFAVLEVLDWRASRIPDDLDVDALPMKGRLDDPSKGLHLYFATPRLLKDRARFVRLGRGAERMAGDSRAHTL